MTREEAIKTIRLTCPKISDSECDFETAMRFLIPELAESEDEKIRKALVEYFEERNNYRDEDETFNGIPFSDIIAYLEKRKEQKPAELKQGKRIEEGDKVKIHCREDRAKDMLSIYNDKVGEVISIWDAEGNPWGPIIVRLDNGCSNGFHEDELDIFDEPPVSEKHY